MTDETIRSPAKIEEHAALTEADYNGWRFIRDAVHFNGRRVFFGYGHRCIDQPRLLVIDKYFKADRSTQRGYMVDGKTQCTSLPEALAALSTPPTLTDFEIQLLGTVPRDWHRPEERVPLLPLAEMGMIEWGRDADNKVTCRMSVAGIQQLQTVHRPGAPDLAPQQENQMTPEASAGGPANEAAALSAHVYEEKPDGRQGTSTTMPVSRFRPQYRALTNEEKALHDALKNKAAEMEALFAQVKPGRYNSLAITSLEQSVMWIVKELTS